jgi:hypothetical protein
MDADYPEHLLAREPATTARDRERFFGQGASARIHARTGSASTIMIPTRTVVIP